MKIIVIGAAGLIGSAVVKALAGRHDIIGASRKAAEHQVDLTDKASVQRLFNQVGSFDAVVCVAGGAAYKPLLELTDDEFAMSVNYKQMGQVNIARLAIPHLADGGSITLTTGFFSVEPPPNAAALAMANSAVNGFAIGASRELPRGLRINAVSPPFVGEFRLNGAKSTVESMTAADTALGYVDAVEGQMTGAVIDTRLYAKRPRA